MTGPHVLLLYDYADDVLERRGPHREAHLAWIGEWVSGGRMLMAGALGNPPTGAAFVLPGDDPASLAERVLAAEHRLYPTCLRLVAEGRVRLRDGRADVSSDFDGAARIFNPPAGA